MFGKRAKEHFGDYNCAQAVLKAFQETHNLPEELIGSFEAFGGGRAEGGACGALHAARHLITDPETRAELDERFNEHAGALSCREIRKLGKLKCPGCVEMAARIAAELHGHGTPEKK